LISRRLEHMRLGHSHHFQRVMPNGIVLEIRGQAMPAGGFVSTFSDITAHIEVKKQLQKANENLEKRVAERTEELSIAKAEAEAANRSKTRFLAAASHDLMQPFNALSLFTSVLKQKAQGSNLAAITDNISDSLVAAEALLTDLVDISKLDGGSQTVNKSRFVLNDLLAPLAQEFKVIAQTKNIAFSYLPSFCTVESDKNLLRRIIQNFLSNAFNYCPRGRVVLGARRRGTSLSIEVWDNGAGIAIDKQALIFKEFERLNVNQEQPGLGLGLAICDRISKLITAPISLKSTINKGSGFKVEVQRLQFKVDQKLKNLPDKDKPVQSIVQANEHHALNLLVTTKVESTAEHQGIILVIDNDPLVLKAMVSLLESWSYKVECLMAKADLGQLNLTHTPLMIIADYHLDDQVNGVDLVQEILSEQGWNTPCIINSADPSEPVRQHTTNAQFSFIRKPIKPLALKRLMKQLIIPR